jgi:flagellar assembly factor FliW
MKIVTSQFGELDIPDNLLIRMTKPVLGFETLREYIIVETPDFEPFKWYQSTENQNVAFVLVNPLLFFPDYAIEVNPKEIEELKVDDVADIVTYAIVTIPRDYTRMTVNLRGPLLINTKTRLAKQLVLVNSHYGIKHRLFEVAQSNRQPEETTRKVPVRA